MSDFAKGAKLKSWMVEIQLRISTAMPKEEVHAEAITSEAAKAEGSIIFQHIPQRNQPQDLPQAMHLAPYVPKVAVQSYRAFHLCMRLHTTF